MILMPANGGPVVAHVSAHEEQDLLRSDDWLPHGKEDELWWSESLQQWRDFLQDYERRIEKYSPGLWQAQETLQKISELAHGWDGDQAMPVSSQALNLARMLISEYPGLTRNRFAVVPTLAGGIQMEWSKGSKDLEIEFVGSDRFEYLKADEQSGRSEEGSGIIADLGMIPSLVDWLDDG